MPEYHTSAVAFDDLKNAAVYFDHVIPVAAAIDLLPQLASADQAWRGEFDEILKCLPPSLAINPEFLETLGNVNLFSYYFLCKSMVQEFSLPKHISGLPDSEFEDVERSFATKYFSLIDRFELHGLPLASTGAATSAWMADDSDVQPSPVVTLANLRLLDPSAASWKHIHEFRKDAVARGRLRRLRLFALEKYSGRSSAFIEDDLLSRIDEYNEAVRQWGFETVHGTVSAVLGSKLTAGVIGGTFLASLLGQPAALCGGRNCP